MDGWFTVVCRPGGVEVVEGDLADRLELQEVGQEQGFWVAVARCRHAADAYAEAYWDYLTDQPWRSGHHFGRLLRLAHAAQVPRIRIVPPSAID